MATIHEYLRMKGQQSYDQKMRDQGNRDTVNQNLDRSMVTKATGIPDMRSAYIKL